MIRNARRASIWLITTMIALTGIGTASAHVRYVVDDPGDVRDVVAFVVETVSVPLHAGLLAGSALGVGVGVLAYRRVRPFARDVELFTATMREYRDLLPWLLRLSIGIPLVGAGFSGYYFTPLVQSNARLLFIGLGFLVLFGLATRFAAGIAVLVYLYGLAQTPALLLQFEYVGGLLALIVVGSGRPSADDVLERLAADDDSTYGRVDPVHRLAGRFRDAIAPAEPFTPVVIRVTLGLTFCYLGLVEKLLNPGPGIAVVARYDLTAIVPVAPELWVLGAALAEIAVGLVLIVGAYTRGAAALSLVLFTVTLFALPDDPVLAHLSLFGLASALLITGAGPYSIDDNWSTADPAA